MAGLTARQYAQLARARKYCITRFVPKLAYVVSDILVYVSTEPWSSQVYYAQVQNLFEIASSSVRSAGKPFLLLVRNCATLDDAAADMSVTTIEFMSEHGLDCTNPDEPMLSLFSGILCVTLPHKHHPLHERKMLEFQALLEDLIRARLERRAYAGSIFNDNAWFYAFCRVTEQLASNVMIDMGQLLSEFLMPTNIVQRNAYEPAQSFVLLHLLLLMVCHVIDRCKFFTRLYHDALLGCSDTTAAAGAADGQLFLHCREAVIHYAAVLFAEEVIGRLIQEYPGQSDDSLLRVIDKIEPTAEWRGFIRAVMQVVDKRTPCAACHPQQRDIRCSQSRLGHECHRSPKKVSAVLHDDTLVVRVLKGVGFGFRPAWAGEFEPPFQVDEHFDEHTFLRCMTQYLRQVVLEGSLAARTNVLETLVFPIVRLPRQAMLDLPFEPFCLLCFQPTDSAEAELDRGSGLHDGDRCCEQLCDSCAATFATCPLMHVETSAVTPRGVPRASASRTRKQQRLSTSEIVQATSYTFSSE